MYHCLRRQLKSKENARMVFFHLNSKNCRIGYFPLIPGCFQDNICFFLRPSTSGLKPNSASCPYIHSFMLFTVTHVHTTKLFYLLLLFPFLEPLVVATQSLEPDCLKPNPGSNYFLNLEKFLSFSEPQSFSSSTQ